MENTENRPQRGFKDYLLLAARGFCMGASDVVPGVSGGTMAFILGIYEELIQAIHSVNLDLIKSLLKFRFKEALNIFPWKFLLAVGLGIVTAFITLAGWLSWALENYPELVWSFFFGLVLGAVVTVRKRVNNWNVAAILMAAAAAIGAYLLVGLVPAETPEAPWFLFLSGAIAICAMILPGVSGAFILVLLGKYKYVLDALTQRDIVTLAIVAAGCGVGLVSFARLLRWLFKNYYDLTVAALTGFMIGSLRKVWPWKETLEVITGRHGELIPVLQRNVLPSSFSADLVFSIVLMALGFGIVVFLEFLASKGEKTKEA